MKNYQFFSLKFHFQCARAKMVAAFAFQTTFYLHTVDFYRSTNCVWLMKIRDDACRNKRSPEAANLHAVFSRSPPAKTIYSNSTKWKEKLRPKQLAGNVKSRSYISHVCRFHHGAAFLHIFISKYAIMSVYFAWKLCALHKNHKYGASKLSTSCQAIFYSIQKVNIARFQQRYPISGTTNKNEWEIKLDFSKFCGKFSFRLPLLVSD